MWAQFNGRIIVFHTIDVGPIPTAHTTNKPMKKFKVIEYEAVKTRLETIIEVPDDYPDYCEDFTNEQWNFIHSETSKLYTDPTKSHLVKRVNTFIDDYELTDAELIKE